ncbi:MAG: hypothetical protein CBB97_24630 [Candidatus Endolissoclinum sp. TMED37]|nr:MAG: hypothetical protein CBB97_24630 [Candidatus Endolissoclinum sp. TMED37]
MLTRQTLWPKLPQQENQHADGISAQPQGTIVSDNETPSNGYVDAHKIEGLPTRSPHWQQTTGHLR